MPRAAIYRTSSGCRSDRSLSRSRPPARGSALDLDLGAELHYLLGRHAEERRRTLGVALQECEQRFPPYPHARNILARDDGLAADVIGDVGKIDAGQLALLAGQHQAFIDRGILHEA